MNKTEQTSVAPLDLTEGERDLAEDEEEVEITLRLDDKTLDKYERVARMTKLSVSQVLATAICLAVVRGNVL